MLPPVKVSSSDGRRWTLLEPYTWQSWTVPAGFVTDFASTPRIIWGWLPPTGRYMGAAVIHDYLYVVNRVTRADADRVFLEAMRDAGVNPVRRQIMYRAVRWFGGSTWDRYRSMDQTALHQGRGIDDDNLEQAALGWVEWFDRE